MCEYGNAHPEWVKKLTCEGGDALCNAWQESYDPGVMIDILMAANKCRDLVKILHAFAFKTGNVGELLKLEPLIFSK